MTTGHSQGNPMDAAMSFWRDAWARVGSAAGQGASGGTSGSGAPNAADPMGWMPTPDTVRKMQSAFMDAMAATAEQYMRSPQFLDAMKQSLESAVNMRRQMEEYLRRNMQESLRTPAT